VILSPPGIHMMYGWPTWVQNGYLSINALQGRGNYGTVHPTRCMIRSLLKEPTHSLAHTLSCAQASCLKRAEQFGRRTVSRPFPYRRVAAMVHTIYVLYRLVCRAKPSNTDVPNAQTGVSPLSSTRHQSHDVRSQYCHRHVDAAWDVVTQCSIRRHWYGHDHDDPIHRGVLAFA
jgi:hypothetical protein